MVSLESQVEKNYFSKAQLTNTSKKCDIKSNDQEMINSMVQSQWSSVLSSGVAYLKTLQTNQLTAQRQRRHNPNVLLPLLAPSVVSSGRGKWTKKVKNQNRFREWWQSIEASLRHYLLLLKDGYLKTILGNAGLFLSCLFLHNLAQ